MANALKARRCGLMKIKRKIHGNRMRMSIKSNDTLYTSRCTVNQIETELQCIFLCRFLTDFVFCCYSARYRATISSKSLQNSRRTSCPACWNSSTKRLHFSTYSSLCSKYRGRFSIFFRIIAVLISADVSGHVLLIRRRFLHFLRQ